jgi:hypothetical protein
MTSLTQDQVVQATPSSYYDRRDEAAWLAGEWVTRYVAEGGMQFRASGQEFRRTGEVRAAPPDA